MRVTKSLIAFLVSLFLAAFVAACSDDSSDIAACEFEVGFEDGDEGHADPLGTVGPGQARAGRIAADKLPANETGLAVWEPGDFVLANDRIAVIVEDAGPSDLYDPWGGKLVGMSLVTDNQMTEVADFGEFFLLTGRHSVVVQSVSVISDGSNGEAAVVRSHGVLAPTPFFESIASILTRDDYYDIPTAIEWVLEPDADHVDIYMVYNSPRTREADVPVVIHGFMYSLRMPAYAPELGFDNEGQRVPYIAFIDDDAASWAFASPIDGSLGAGISQSGFSSNLGEPFVIDACGQTRRHHARLTIGGPGLDGLLQSVAAVDEQSLREISGLVTESNGAPATGVRVHATSGESYITRATTDETGRYALHVPDGLAVELTTWRQGDMMVGPVPVAANESTSDIALQPAGVIQVTSVDDTTGQALPVRIQVLPESGEVPRPPGAFGEPTVTSGRLHVEYAMDGQATMRAPVGQWEVVVSRGYEYEIYREVVTVTEGNTAQVQARLEHVVNTTGYMCADYHIHTHRSNDSGDDARIKLQSGVADGLDIPVRSEHEFVDGFQTLIEELGLADYAFGVGSIELTSFVLWGHMGVLPLEPDASQINNGAPLWQRFPSADNPEAPVETMLPPEVFATVRQRPERPIIIINHPRRNGNYFDSAGYDRATGQVMYPDYWDEEFHVVEIFNSDSWQQNFDDLVADWLSFLNFGRRVFAVGSSDSHSIRGTPLGYPRTCLDVGTDNPRELTPEIVRDVTGAGHSTISGGIYVYATVAGAGPGEDANGVGANTTVNVRVEAATWVDVDAIDVVVDGEVVNTIDILPEDANPQNPAIRYEADIPISVADQVFGSYVIVAAYGDQSMNPVHPGRQPFGVINPIFMTR